MIGMSLGILNRLLLRTSPPLDINASSVILFAKERLWRLSRLLESDDKRKFRHKVLRRPPTQNIGIIGAPLVYGQPSIDPIFPFSQLNLLQPLQGACAAPDLLRGLRLAEVLKSKGANVKDYGNLEFRAVPNDFAVVLGCNYARTVGRANKQIQDEVSNILKNGESVLVLGGDHSVGLGSVSGHAKIRQDMALLWVDAHPDINTPLTSTSGNLHGMPVSFLVKELPHLSPRVPGLEWVEPCISSRNIAYIGLRSVDLQEKMFLRTLGICNFTMEDIKELGIDTAVTNALDRIDPEGKRSIHLSFDVDALDPLIIPATGTPVPNGLDFRQALTIARIVYNTRRMSVMDVVELNPLLSTPSAAIRSAQVTVEIIARAFTGKRMRYPSIRDVDI
ncbi:hypothetical protein EGW08_000093 [Elysia chlorotica]|uniref:Arginase n=1 Tax=Elysia chlorotica TaxID=188477 RepID=A0A433UE52_ELYCH|nr:hypothetical protein EGW08_000093 [Elysia chlorotica]